MIGLASRRRGKMDVQGGREREEGQAAWSPWRGVEELIWSKDTGL